MTKKEKVLVIVGPTAVGKTALSVELAHLFNGSVISGDSMQVYRGLDIGTAKATATEQQGIPHLLIDEREINEGFSVADFQELGRQYISQVTAEGKLPIVVGGTGLYIQSLLFDFQLGSQESKLADLVLREELMAYAKAKGNDLLWERLKQVDPKAAEEIHPNNVKRVIRAIEVMTATGKSITEQAVIDFRNLNNALYDVKLIGLATERESLYERINQRVDLMVAAGLLEEAQFVYDNYQESQAAQGIGYKELFPYFAGEEELNSALATVQQNSRRYAKRQLTWFKNRMSVEWWDLLAEPEMKQQLLSEVQRWLES